MKKTLFIKNAAILTATSAALRIAGIILRLFVAKKIGAEGMGLYQLTFSIFVLFSAFASSGICTAVTRICSEELSFSRGNTAKRAVYRGITASLILATVSMLILYFGADFISESLLSDRRAILPIKLLGAALPFMGISSVIKGYFIARRNAMPGAFAGLFEQAVRIAAILLLIGLCKEGDVAALCSAVIAGDCIGEAGSALLCFALYLFDRIKLPRASGGRERISKEIFRIALPITASKYLGCALRTTENILVPKALSLESGGSGLKLFGMIKGMALPILFFPSALLGAVSTLLIPEMAEEMAQKQSSAIRSTCERVVKITLLLGSLAGGIFLVSGREIGSLFYVDADIGLLLEYLSPIVPLMYADSVCDALLKGLDRQKYTFISSIADSAIRILLIALLLPHFGIWGFIGIMYFSNLFTFLLHLLKLMAVSGMRIKVKKYLIFPCLISVLAATIPDRICKYFNLQNNLVYIILIVSITSAAYILWVYRHCKAEILPYSVKKIIKK